MDRREAIKALVVAPVTVIGGPDPGNRTVEKPIRGLVFTVLSDAWFPEANSENIVKLIRERFAKMGHPDVEVLITQGMDLRLVVT
jgi:hypothetical protein